MDPLIEKMVQTFFWLRIWRRKNEPISKLYKFLQICIFLIFYVFYAISLALGAFISDSVMESVYLCVTFLSVILLSAYLLTFSWKQNEVELILQNIAIDKSSYGSEDVNKKLLSYTKFSNFFKSLAVVGSVVGMVLPMLQNSIPFKIWFPLDWKSDTVSYWLAVLYCLICYTFSIVTAVYLRLFVWFVMLSFSLQYELLGKQFKSLGHRKLSNEMDELKECINRHRNIKA